MVDILHRAGIKSASIEDVYKALTTIQGLSDWWTKDTKGESDTVGGKIQFRFGENGGFDMKVNELEPCNKVVWEVLDGPPEWVGTKINWNLKQEDDYIIVLFKHQGWKEAVEGMHHCSTKWAIFIMSLKALIEKGKGQPYPDDTLIDNWR